MDFPTPCSPCPCGCKFFIPAGHVDPFRFDLSKGKLTVNWDCKRCHKRYMAWTKKQPEVEEPPEPEVEEPEVAEDSNWYLTARSREVIQQVKKEQEPNIPELVANPLVVPSGHVRVEVILTHEAFNTIKKRIPGLGVGKVLERFIPQLIDSIEGRNGT